MGLPDTAETIMTEHDAGNELARLLLPYRRRFSGDEDPPDHEHGWWFAGAPPDAVSEALSLVRIPPDERPNDQPPEGWLVAQAKVGHGVLAGFAAPGDPDGPRMRVDAIVVPCEQAEDLAREIAKLWPVEDCGTALDLAVVEGLAVPEAQRHEWEASGSEFLDWRAGADDWLGAPYCSFWWD
jgi:hypothetical protein